MPNTQEQTAQQQSAVSDDLKTLQKQFDILRSEIDVGTSPAGSYAMISHSHFESGMTAAAAVPVAAVAVTGKLAVCVSIELAFSYIRICNVWCGTTAAV